MTITAASLITTGLAMISALAVFLAFWIGSRIAVAVSDRIARRDPARREAVQLIGAAARVGLLVFGAVTALGTAGVDVTALVAGLGLTGFALGFALKDILSSAVAGVLILFNRPFRSGDRITVAGFSGAVLAVDLRYVTLAADGGGRYLVPNATVLTSPVTVQPPASPAPATAPAAA